MSNLTQERLKELLSYNHETGVFTWMVTRSWRAEAGTVAGRENITTGYIEIQIDGHRYKAHRLAWLYVHGEQTSKQIDHVNQNKTDNRIANLRPATRSENKMNVGINKANSSGVKGVSRKDNKWCAAAQINGKKHWLGRFDDIADDRKAYEDFCKQHYGEFYSNSGV